MAERDWFIRAYREGDEHHILHLFKLVFGKERSLSHWKWKFAHNPYSPVNAALACSYPDGEIIGQHTVLPLKINFLGDPLLACQELDTMTHPDFRGRGISVKTAQHCYAEFKHNGTSLIYGFPNESAYPVLMRRLGWKRILHLMEYSFLLDASQALESALQYSLPSRVGGVFYNLFIRVRVFSTLVVLRNRLPKSVVLRRSNCVPEGYEKLWDSIRKHEVVSVWKDSEYLKWRYDDNPDHKYEYLYFIENGEMAALAIVRAERGKDLLICELLVKARNVSIGRLLIYEILWDARGKGIRKAVFIGSDGGFYDEVFEDFRCGRLFGIPLCVRVFEGETIESYAMQASNWTITYGDMDLV